MQAFGRKYCVLWWMMPDIRIWSCCQRSECSEHLPLPSWRTQLPALQLCDAGAGTLRASHFSSAGRLTAVSAERVKLEQERDGAESGTPVPWLFTVPVIAAPPGLVAAAGFCFHAQNRPHSAFLEVPASSIRGQLRGLCPSSVGKALFKVLALNAPSPSHCPPLH